MRKHTAPIIARALLAAALLYVSVSALPGRAAPPSPFGIATVQQEDGLWTLRAEPGDPVASAKLDPQIRQAWDLWRFARGPVIQADGETASRAPIQPLIERMQLAQQQQGGVNFDGPQPGATAIIKVTDGGRELVRQGIQPQAVLGDLATAYLPFDRLMKIAALPSVVAIYGATTAQEGSVASKPARNDKGTADIQAPRVWNELGETGAGVLVAIIDNGIDPFHPDFIKPDGTTRIKYLLDLADPGDRNGDGQLDGTVYGGTEYSEAQINAALAAPGSFTRSPGNPKAIPDNNTAGVAWPINLADTAPVTSVAVETHILHPKIGQLRLTLTCPNGATVTLQDQVGGDGDNIIGSFQTTACNGQPANGTWTLRVMDLVAGDAGQINFWNLLINRQMRATDQDGHGTYVAGSAAGGGRGIAGGVANGRYRGVAPDADLLIVQAQRARPRSTRTLFSDVMNAMKWIDEKASFLGKPYVINMSLGVPGAGQDGTSPIEQAIDGLVGPGKKGKAVVVNAGNSGDKAIHAAGQVPAAGVKELRFRIPSLPGGAFEAVDLWYSGKDAFGIGFRSPSGAGLVRTINPGENGKCYYPNTLTFFLCVYSYANSPQNGDNEIVIEIQVTPAEQGEWTLWLHGDQVHDGKFHAWQGRQAEWTTDAQNSHRIWVPGTARNAITVGAYTTKNQWLDVDGNLWGVNTTLGAAADFSSDGPTRDGRIKPDIAAPGDKICSSLSGQVLPGMYDVSVQGRSFTCNSLQYMLSQGTSAAAPHVTGVVALLLGMKPDLDAAQIKTLLQNTTRRDGFTGAVPNTKWGYGKVDAYAAARALTQPQTLDKALYLPMLMR